MATKSSIKLCGSCRSPAAPHWHKQADLRQSLAPLARPAGIVKLRQPLGVCGQQIVQDGVGAAYVVDRGIEHSKA